MMDSGKKAQLDWSRIFGRGFQVLAVLTSTGMTVAFFWSLGHGPGDQLLLGGFGLVLEVGKVWAWSRANRPGQ
jgi:hypothetical protein